ncbi:MAG TPA: hypothetical protein DDZ51_01785 [Planctomycetaceae bacterium]|nr:hypothetical protein [Planctomycetaceae bacterium]
MSAAAEFGRVTCGSCGKSIKFPAARLGSSGKCPSCSEIIRLSDVALESLLNKPPELPPPIKSTSQTSNAGMSTVTHVTIAAPVKSEFVGKKTAAALIAIFLFGAFGSHKFYLGLHTGGLIMAILTSVGVLGACLMFPLVIVVITSSIALIEGFVYLSKSDDQFYEDYAIRKKQWF